MERHQHRSLVAFQLLAVRICHQGDFFQKARQAPFRHPLAVVAAGRDQFAQVVQALRGLVGVFLLVGVFHARFHDHALAQLLEWRLARSQSLLPAAHGIAHGCHLGGSAHLRRRRRAQGLHQIATEVRVGQSPVGFQGFLADAAARRRDSALQGHHVARVHQKAQPRERVLHLGAVVETHAAHHHVGDAFAAQRLFNGARLAIGAVEDSRAAALPEGALTDSGATPRLHLLVLLVVDGDEVAGRSVGAQGLLLAHLVLGDDAGGGLQDVRGGAVVLLELHHVGARVVLLEVEDVLEVSAAPGVDGLVVVAHHHDVAVAGQLLHQPVLDRVGVLVLVDEDVAEALLPVLAPLGMLAQKLQGIEEQVVEVHGVLFQKTPAIALKDAGCGLLGGVRRLGQILGRLVGVLGGADDPAQRIRGIGLDPELGADVVDDLLLVRVVVDGEAVAIAEQSGVAAQDAGTDAVKGAHPLRGFAAHEFLGALAHLFGGLVGEGQGHDLPGLPAHVRH